MQSALGLVTDPDYLAVIARCFHEINILERPVESKSFELPRTVRCRANILDSLAYVLVSRTDKQIVAVGATQDGDGLKLFVSENQEVQEGTKQHLRDILDRLRTIRDIHHGQGGSSRVKSFAFETGATLSTFDRHLIDLEVIILYHAWKKLAQRFRKNSRQMNFIRVAKDVLGPPAIERVDDRTEEERTLLGALQLAFNALSSTLDRSRGEFDVGEMLEAVQALEGALRPDVDESLFRDGIRDLVHIIRGGKKMFSRDPRFCQLWDTFTRERLQRKWADRGMPSESGARPRKEPDVLRWLSKSTVLSDHVLKLASVATSNTLAASFLSTETEIVFLKNPPPPPITFSIDQQSIREVLEAAGVHVEEEDVGKIDAFLDRLAKSHMVTRDKDDKLLVNASEPVHCECRVLQALHGEQAIPLIGVSKPSCACCDAYFAAYRDVTKTNFHTSDTHDQIQTWRCPTFRETSRDAQVRQKVCDRLMQKIRRGWEVFDERFRRESQRSQSTDASDHPGGPSTGDPVAHWKNNTRFNDWLKNKA